MRRANVVLGVVSAVAVALLALVDGGGSHRFSSTVEATRGEPEQAPETSPNAETDQPTAVVPLPRVEDDQNGTVTEAPSDTRAGNNTRRRAPPDENAFREQVKRQTTQDVQDEYSLLLEDLGLAPEERDALVALLIEIQIAATYISGGQPPITMPEQERLDSIAAIIGDPKLQQFLALEQKRGAYWEVGKIGSLLRRNGVPLTDTQRDGLLKILVDVHDRYTMPPSDLDRDSIEYVEYVQTQWDEYDRHAIELTPSVLSPTQGVYLFEQYQRMADERAQSLERHKKRRAANPTKDVLLDFPPRWRD